MSRDRRLQRAVLAGTEAARAQLGAAFAQPPLAGWEAQEADSLEQARFLLQAGPYAVVVVDGGPCRPAGFEGLAWLTGQIDAAVLLLAEADPDLIRDALRCGVHGWLPRELALANPELLEAALNQAARLADLRRRAAGADDGARQQRRRADRLLDLLWEATPAQGAGPWYSQRCMLERLEEEVARARRHPSPLTVVLGEVRPADRDRVGPADWRRLASWSAGQVGRSKRRCDVAGQYGLQGFMLLLPQADAAEAAGACRRLGKVLAQPAVGPFPPLHASFGLASVTPDVTTVAGLLRRAEEQLERDNGRLGMST